MPVADVTTTGQMTDEKRAGFARTLTGALKNASGAPGEKIQIFFWHGTGADTIAVKAVKNGASPEDWKASVHGAVGHSYTVTVKLLDANHTARNGKLRKDPSNPSTTEPERS